MSTKIYDGFRIRTNGEDLYDLERLIQFIEAARDHMNQKAVELATEWFAKTCTAILDRETLGLYTKRDLDASVVADVYLHEILDKDLGRDNDYGVEITIHPIVGVERKVLGILFTGNNDLRKEWFQFRDPISEGYIQEYHYQDQTDPPEDISERDWRWRRKDWEYAVTERRNGSPVMAGLTATLVPEGIPVEILSIIGDDNECQELVDNVPCWSDRVKHRTDDLLFDRWMKEKPQSSELYSYDEASSDSKQVTVGDVIKHVRAFNEFKKTAEGRTQELDTTEEVEQTLKRNLTVADFRTPRESQSYGDVRD